MKPPLPNQDLIDAEQRAEARRVEEKKRAETEAAAAKAKADAQVEREIALQKAKAALALKVPERCADLARLAEEARKEPDKLRARAQAIEARIGDLEGAITTARDVAKVDPQRALDTLQRAEAAFKAPLK